MPPPPIAWTIAGSDSGGHAGIQADLQTFANFKVHGCSVLTAVTAQSSRELEAVHPLPADWVHEQLEVLKKDLAPRAIKLGLLGSWEIAQAVFASLADWPGFLAWDPVLEASVGGALADGDWSKQLRAHLRRADILTPNRPEAEQLSGLTIRTAAEMEKAVKSLLEQGARSVLLKGGHIDFGDEAAGSVWDCWSDGSQLLWLRSRKINTAHTRGSGCTLSAAITAAVAAGYTLEDALVLARAHLSWGLRHAAGVGAGPGPVAHGEVAIRLQDLPLLSHAFPSLPSPVFPRCEVSALGLYPVVDSAEWVERMLAFGVKTVQLRIKDASAAALEREIARAAAAAVRCGARLVVNDHWQAAIRHRAWGVHLGQEDLAGADLSAIALAGLRLGISTHNWCEIARAHALRPSYIALGPVFPTLSKPMSAPPLGLEQLGEWSRLLGDDYPLVAIGGIDSSNAGAVLDAGVSSIAMIRAITDVPDPAAAVLRLQRQVAARRGG